MVSLELPPRAIRHGRALIEAVILKVGDATMPIAAVSRIHDDDLWILGLRALPMTEAGGL